MRPFSLQWCKKYHVEKYLIEWVNNDNVYLNYDQYIKLVNENFNKGVKTNLVNTPKNERPFALYRSYLHKVEENYKENYKGVYKEDLVEDIISYISSYDLESFFAAYCIEKLYGG